MIQTLLSPVLCLTLGMLSGYGMDVGPESWYAQLQRPAFNPPNWIFGPVWTILYIMLGLALARIWTIRHQKPWFLGLFMLQFSANLAWSPIFFRYHAMGLALILLIFLWAVTSCLLLLLRKNKAIFYLILPYWGWVTFAFFLNYQFYIINT